MTMESYWEAVLHEVNDKDNTERFFRYTTVGPEPLVLVRRKRTKGHVPKKKTKLKVGEPYPAVYFTQREFDCMFSLVRGRTVKETAVDLVLSPRTVEYYIKNLKQKLCCQTRSELLDRALDTDLIKGALAAVA